MAADRSHPTARAAARPPEVKLGSVVQGGLAPAILAVVERGVNRRPELAGALDAEIELSMHGDYPPVRIVLDPRTALIEDGAASDPDLRITGSLPDLVSLMVAPLVRGVPSPVRARGRAAIGLVALRRVKIQGRLALMRQFLALIQI